MVFYEVTVPDRDIRGLNVCDLDDDLYNPGNRGDGVSMGFGGVQAGHYPPGDSLTNGSGYLAPDADDGTGNPGPYDGIRFTGAGPRSRVVPKYNALSGESLLGVNVGLPAQTVEFNDIDFVGGPQWAIYAGHETNAEAGPPVPRPVVPCHLIVKRAFFTSETPPTNNPGSTAWMIFAYQANITLEDVVVDSRQSAEHFQYAHGVGAALGADKAGIRWTRVTILGCGAECLKVRSEPKECFGTAGDPQVIVTDCFFSNWYQPWSSRGGAGIVLQGSGLGLQVRNSVFVGREVSIYSMCIAVDDNGDKGYWNIDDPTQYVGPNSDPFSTDGNSYDYTVSGESHCTGDIVLENVACYGMDVAGNREQIRVGTLAPFNTPYDTHGEALAKSVTFTNCSFWSRIGNGGLGMFLNMKDCGPLSITGCNTATIKRKAAAIPGHFIDTDRKTHLDPDDVVESLFTHNGGGLTPPSSGFP